MKRIIKIKMLSRISQSHLIQSFREILPVLWQQVKKSVSHSQKNSSLRQRILKSQLVESYISIFSSILIWLKKIIFRVFAPSRKYFESTSFRETLYSHLIVWTLISLTGISLAAFTISIIGYGFAHSGQSWFNFIWDNWILSFYSLINFQHIWWILLPGIMAITWILIRPTVLPWKGGWRKRFWALIVSYTLFNALFIIFTWQFQTTIQGGKWFAVVGLFILMHFLFMFSIAILSSVTNRIVPLNKEYIESAKNLIKTDEEPVKHLFELSVYGSFIVRMAGDSFDGTIGRVFDRINIKLKKGKVYKNCKKVFRSIFYLSSFAWLVDRLLGVPYYVKHFELVLKSESYKAELLAREELQQNAVHPAMMNYSKIFDTKTDDEEMQR